MWRRTYLPQKYVLCKTIKTYQEEIQISLHIFFFLLQNCDHNNRKLPIGSPEVCSLHVVLQAHGERGLLGPVDGRSFLFVVIRGQRSSSGCRTAAPSSVDHSVSVLSPSEPHSGFSHILVLCHFACSLWILCIPSAVNLLQPE